MVEVRRRQNESTAAMVRRFTRRVQQSGILIHARKLKFYRSPLTKRNIHERALRRIKVTKERDRLIKLGKLTEDER